MFGLLLTSLGIFGVMAQAVAQQTGEIAIRLAIGAQQRDVLLLILRQATLIIGVGLSAGLVGAFVVVQWLDVMLYQVDPHDPITLLAVSGLLAFVAFVACIVPASRATRVTALVALRGE